MPAYVSDYIRLIGKFVSHEIDVVEFERAYLQAFKSQTIRLPEPEFLVLDKLFSDVDAFCSTSELRGEHDLSEAQLREECVQALERLRA